MKIGSLVCNVLGLLQGRNVIQKNRTAKDGREDGK